VSGRWSFTPWALRRTAVAVGERDALGADGWILGVAFCLVNRLSLIFQTKKYRLAAAQGLPNGNWSLDVYGTGSLASSLKAGTTKNTNIHWHGYIEDKSVLATYDALVYPSRCWETQGLAMAEALAHGTPVIAARIGSIPETIQDGKNGFLYED
jgi:glycosyltransferase involved in cell wall biosynthesis